MYAAGASLLHGIATGKPVQILSTLAIPALAAGGAKFVTNPKIVRKLGSVLRFRKRLRRQQSAQQFGQSDQGQPTFRSRL